MMSTQEKTTNSCNSDPHGLTGSVNFSFPVELNRQAIEHERSLVALLLIDRKSIRTISPELTKDHFLDSFFGEVFDRFSKNHWLPLEELLAETEPHAARTIADSIQGPDGRPRVFRWNLKWHESEIFRLSAIREKFEASLSFLAKYGEVA